MEVCRFFHSSRGLRCSVHKGAVFCGEKLEAAFLPTAELLIIVHFDRLTVKKDIKLKRSKMEGGNILCCFF